MLTALAMCCMAALTPTFLGSTSSPMSRSVPARRAVPVPPPAPAVMATPMSMSLEVVDVDVAPGATGTVTVGLAAGGDAGDERLGGGGGTGMFELPASSRD